MLVQVPPPCQGHPLTWHPAPPLSLLPRPGGRPPAVSPLPVLHRCLGPSLPSTRGPCPGSATHRVFRCPRPMAPAAFSGPPWHGWRVAPVWCQTQAFLLRTPPAVAATPCPWLSSRMSRTLAPSHRPSTASSVSQASGLCLQNIRVCILTTSSVTSGVPTGSEMASCPASRRPRQASSARQ